MAKEPGCPFCGSMNITSHVMQGERLVADGKLHCGDCNRAFPDDKPAYPDPVSHGEKKVD